MDLIKAPAQSPIRDASESKKSTFRLDTRTLRSSE